MEKTPTFKFYTKHSVSLNKDSIEKDIIGKAFQMVSMHYFGDPHSNKFDKKAQKYVGKFDNHKDFPKVQEAHCHINSSHEFHIEWEIGIDGIPKPLRVIPYNDIKWNEKDQVDVD